MNEPSFDVFDDMGIILSDGCRLSARVWLPKGADEQPVPAILEYLPYRKRDGTIARDELTHPWFAARGYACVRVDMRGNGDSEGLMADEYTPQEHADAVEVIDWLAGQDWCTGSVGMMGISWGGFNSLQVAALRPEPLKAIITLCSTDDRYVDDIHYKGGCLLNENMGWGATMLSYSSRPPDPALVGDKWREMWINRLENQPFLPELWLRHQTRDAYWKHGSICEDYSSIQAAVLAIGGWADAYKNPVFRMLENLEAPTKAIVGPWAHKYPHFAIPKPRIGFLQEALKWWDHWLKDADNDVREWPAYRGFVMDGFRPTSEIVARHGRWIAEDEWPSPNIENSQLHLTGDGRLEPQKQAAFEAIVDSPLTCGANAGEYCAIWLGPELPGDQRGDDALSACFDGEPLKAAIDIVGAPEVRLTVVPQAEQGQIAVRLNDVSPDGASNRITYGVLNLSHRQDHEHPTPLEPGVPIEVSVKLDDIAYRIPAGNHIRVAISTSYWPLIWPSPTKSPVMLLSGGVHLPCRQPGIHDAVEFEPAETSKPWRVDVIREASNQRSSSTDHVSGLLTLYIDDDFGEVRDLEHGLQTGGFGRETWTIHPDDPNSARGECHWEQTLCRGNWSVRTVTRCHMTSTENQFDLGYSVEAFEGDDIVFERSQSFTIPRNNL
ncbi:MAG: CocE/NonD family hydrolase [Pseudomonadota bacterium]